MKFKSLTMLLLLLPLCVVLLEAGCDEKEENTIPVCGIENPFVNLDWLKQMKKQIENNSEVTSAKIVLYRLNNIDYVYVHEQYQSTYDVPSSVFDCEGTEKYVCGGNQAPGLDSCSAFFNNAQKIETLWEK